MQGHYNSMSIFQDKSFFSGCEDFFKSSNIAESVAFKTTEIYVLDSWTFNPFHSTASQNNYNNEERFSWRAMTRWLRWLAIFEASLQAEAVQSCLMFPTDWRCSDCWTGFCCHLPVPDTLTVVFLVLGIYALSEAIGSIGCRHSNSRGSMLIRQLTDHEMQRLTCSAEAGWAREHTHPLDHLACYFICWHAEFHNFHDWLVPL